MTTQTEIPLTRGYVARVDPEDFERVAVFRWHATDRGGIYAARNIRVDGHPTKVSMHRFIMAAGSGFVVDHINGDTLDNRKANLRVCTQRQNCRNQRPPRSNSSGFKGVSFDRDSGKWKAYIRHNGRLHNLGRHATAEEAAQAYNVAARERFGEFAEVNDNVEATA